MNFEPGEEDHPPQHWQWILFSLGIVAIYVLGVWLFS